MQQLLSRLWFLNQGCKQVPLDAAKNHVRWGHPDGYFLNAQGQRVKDNLSPSHAKHCNNHPAPNLRECGMSCHRAMALAHYGPCPIFIDPNKGKKYKGLCHHLIPDLKDYHPANLLCWLTHEQHREADHRQRALREILPDMHAIPYERHRYLQDPRTTCREVFELELQQLAISTRMAYDFTHHMEY